MNKFYFTLFVASMFSTFVNAQKTTLVSPCSEDEILARQIDSNPDALLEMEANEEFIKTFIKQLRADKMPKNIEQQPTEYIIPVVLHVFHNGDDGMIDMDQAQSGIDIINADFNGLNDDWDMIDPAFDGIKATLDIQLCLASIDPEGNPTSGVIYYDDEDAMYNIPDLFQYAWDNYQYLNIYLPKYTGGGPSDFTAYAYYPSTNNSDNDRDGIFYSSIRWGFGTHSELNPGDEWASVGTHEVGHWLNLRHTFENGCNSPGDYVDDTPPITGTGLQFSGCYNNNFSCSAAVNGENYMDYNINCKKMFTQGQVERMTAGLNLSSRSPLWSSSNLIETGCFSPPTSISEVLNNNPVLVYPNPANSHINFQFEEVPVQFSIYNAQGKLVFDKLISEKSILMNTNGFRNGLFFYYSMFGNKISNGKFITN